MGVGFGCLDYNQEQDQATNWAVDKLSRARRKEMLGVSCHCLDDNQEQHKAMDMVLARVVPALLNLK